MDRKEGFGTLYMVNGDKFSGCFKDDAIEGFGSFYNSKQQKNINGIWMNNVLKHWYSNNSNDSTISVFIFR